MNQVDATFKTEVQCLFEKYNILLQEAGKEISKLKAELLQCKENEKRLTAVLLQKKKHAALNSFSEQSSPTANNSQRQRKRKTFDEQEYHQQQVPRKQGLFSKLNNYGYR